MNDEINGLPLPVALTTALERGVWRTPPMAEAWKVLFPQERTHHARLYDRSLLAKENASWRDEADSAYLGQVDDQHPRGDIDPARSLLIADLGPDKLIALDYRDSLSRPTVLHLVDEPEGSRWVKVAPDVETFMRTLGLDAVESQAG